VKRTGAGAVVRPFRFRVFATAPNGRRATALVSTSGAADAVAAPAVPVPTSSAAIWRRVRTIVVVMRCAKKSVCDRLSLSVCVLR
jgi:hypothetical protein